MTEPDPQPSVDPSQSDGGASEDGPDAEPKVRLLLGQSAAASATSDMPEAVPADAEIRYTELARVHNARDLAEAMLIKGTLESFHIPCAIEEGVGADMAFLSGAHLHGVDVFVPPELVAQARDVLCERGIACSVDDDRLQELAGRLDAAADDAEALDALVADLEAEPRRDLRHAVLERLAHRGPAGLECGLKMLERSIDREGEEDPQVFRDLAILIDRGVFGGAASLTAVGRLSRLAGADRAAVRQRAARGLRKVRGAGASAALVTLLSDEEEAVRDEACEALYFLTRGVSHGFKPDGPEEERRASVERWRAWQQQYPST